MRLEFSMSTVINLNAGSLAARKCTKNQTECNDRIPLQESCRAAKEDCPTYTPLVKESYLRI